jgi:hypothetical protein
MGVMQSATHANPTQRPRIHRRGVPALPVHRGVWLLRNISLSYGVSQFNVNLILTLKGDKQLIKKVKSV